MSGDDERFGHIAADAGQDAGARPVGVGHDNVIRAGVSQRHAGDGEHARVRTGEVGAVEPPLIGDRHAADGGYGQVRHVSGQHLLVAHAIHFQRFDLQHDIVRDHAEEVAGDERECRRVERLHVRDVIIQVRRARNLQSCDQPLERGRGVSRDEGRERGRVTHRHRLRDRQIINGRRRTIHDELRWRARDRTENIRDDGEISAAGIGVRAAERERAVGLIERHAVEEPPVAQRLRAARAHA